MARSFNELRAEMTLERRKRVALKAEAIKRELPLQELRLALSLSQEQVAEVLKIKQAAVSKLERRTDLYLSTLRRYIEAMGGTLEITARFPDGDVRIDQFAGGKVKAKRKSANARQDKGKKSK